VISEIDIWRVCRARISHERHWQDVLPPPRSVNTSPALPRACPISLRETAPGVCGMDPPFSGRTARLPWGEVYIFGPVQGALATENNKRVAATPNLHTASFHPERWRIGRLGG
jgi:hypothetical protein